MSRVLPRTTTDIWIERELKRSYDSVLAEPVPPELLRLLQPTGTA